MEPVLYLMAILGCGNAGAGCRAVRMPPARYASVAACRAAAEAVLTANTDLDYPMLRADCCRSSALRRPAARDSQRTERMAERAVGNGQPRKERSPWTWPNR